MAGEAQVRETDVVVIGAGPGGYVAAFAVADRGMKVLLVEADEQPGGVCLNRGCIPSKALLHVARLISETREAADWGLTFAPPAIDLEVLRRWKNEVVGKNASGVRQLAKVRNVEIVRAWARFENSQTLLLSSQRGGQPDLGRLKFQRAVLATGSRPAMIPACQPSGHPGTAKAVAVAGGPAGPGGIAGASPALKLDSPRVMDSTAALELQTVPKSLLVVGGGYIGLEMGTAYAALGSEVTVVEMTYGLLPGVDRDLVRVLEGRLKTTFKSVYLQSKVVKMADTGQAVEVTFEPAGEGLGRVFDPEAQTRRETRPSGLKNPPPRSQQYDRVLVSVGRTPNSEGLGLENTRVKVGPRGFIEVDRQLRTADEHIYAIGDVVGEPMLAHKASYEAKVVAEVLAGKRAAADARAIPAVVFTDPEIAWTGLTETQARKVGTPVKIAKFPWGASGRATAMGRNDGLTKVIADPQTHRLLGVGIVGVGAGELIAEATLAIEMGATAHDLGLTIHPHPTLSETLCEAAELAFGAAIHLAPPRK